MFSMTLWGFLGLVLVLAIVGVGIGCAVSADFRRTVAILFGRGRNKVTTAIEREIQLIKEQEAVIENGRHTVSDLKGKLETQRGVLRRLEGEETSLVSDVRLAKSQATTRIKGLTPDITDEALTAQLQQDKIVLGQAQLLANKRQEVTIQKQTVAQMESTVGKTQEAVEEAKQKLTELQLQVKSDEAKAQAATALRGATDVLESFKGLNAAGAELNRTRTQIEDEFNGANARFEDAQGDPAQREFEKAKRNQGLGDLIKDI